jgi:hypothetical protein
MQSRGSVKITNLQQIEGKKKAKKILFDHTARVEGKKRMDSSSTGAQHGWRIQVKENGREIDVQLSGSGTVSDVEVEQRAAKVRAILAFAIRAGPFVGQCD